MLSDENQFEESYGEESDFNEAGSAEADDVALFMDDQEQDNDFLQDLKDTQAMIVPIKKGKSKYEQTKLENDKESKNTAKKKKEEKKLKRSRSKSTRSKKIKKNSVEYAISKIEHYKEKVFTSWDNLVAIKED